MSVLLDNLKSLVLQHKRHIEFLAKRLKDSGGEKLEDVDEWEAEFLSGKKDLFYLNRRANYIIEKLRGMLIDLRVKELEELEKRQRKLKKK